MVFSVVDAKTCSKVVVWPWRSNAGLKLNLTGLRCISEHLQDSILDACTLFVVIEIGSQLVDDEMDMTVNIIICASIRACPARNNDSAYICKVSAAAHDKNSFLCTVSFR